MWATIRRAEEEDYAILQKKAREFCKRHGISNMGLRDPVDDIDFHIHETSVVEPQAGSYIRRLWQRIVARALREPAAEGIAYGYVGYHVKG